MNMKQKKGLVIAGMVVVIIMLVRTMQLVMSISRSGHGEKAFYLYFFNHDGDFNLWIQKYDLPHLYPLFIGLLAILVGIFGLIRYKKRFQKIAKWGILFLLTIGGAYIVFSFLINRDTFPKYDYNSAATAILAIIAFSHVTAVFSAAFGLALKQKWAWGLAVSLFIYNICGYVVFLILKNIFIIASRFEFGKVMRDNIDIGGYEFAWYISDILSVWPAAVGLAVLLLIHKYILDWSTHFEVLEEKQEFSLFGK